jgi:hypothetical protein
MKGHFLYYLRAALWLTEVTRGCSRKNFLISLSERSICVLKACNSGRLEWVCLGTSSAFEISSIVYSFRFFCLMILISPHSLPMCFHFRRPITVERIPV